MKKIIALAALSAFALAACKDNTQAQLEQQQKQIEALQQQLAQQNGQQDNTVYQLTPYKTPSLPKRKPTATTVNPLPAKTDNSIFTTNPQEAGYFKA